MQLTKATLSFLIVSLAFVFSSCQKDLEANFEPETSTIIQGQSITFSDLSIGKVTEWHWTFEGGSPATSTAQNPTVTYNQTGTFSVTLTVKGKKGENTKTVTGAVTVQTNVDYQTPVFADFSVTSNVVYGTGSADQFMHIYEPVGDTRTERPFLLIFGGGGFGGMNMAQLEPMATEIVKYGIVVCVAKYRQGPASPGVEYFTRLIEGVQDTKAAVRYLRANANSLRVDTNNIINGGYSTGGILAIMHSYTSEAEIPATELSFVNSLGGWEGNQGSPGFSSNVAACVAWAGGKYVSLDDITPGDVPMFCIHGDQDLDMPYDWSLTAGGDTLYGSLRLTQKATEVGITNDLYTIVGGNHDNPKTDYADYIDELMLFLKGVIED